MVQGTIFPAPNFNPVMDAQVLEGALQGFDCDKDLLLDILTQRSGAQRQVIAEAYQGMCGRDLLGDLKEKLSGHFKDVMVGLMYPPPSYDAHELWHAMKGAGTEENCLIDILASRTNGEIFQMREAYYMQYSSDLQEDIYSETSGHFRDTLVNLVQGTREEGYADPAVAAQDAVVNRTRSASDCQTSSRGAAGRHLTLCALPGAVGGLSAEDRGAQDAAASDSVHQELPTAVAG
ncbi:hypothetical protein CB1_000677007 [Camelus ferus]|nr:hypothetical protein CB1_000677007 [Camelus ferus]